jgi:hypothetical protein
MSPPRPVQPFLGRYDLVRGSLQKAWFGVNYVLWQHNNKYSLHTVVITVIIHIFIAEITVFVMIAHV